MKKLDSWIVAIPSRLGSTRLSRKALADIHGKPMVVRVYEAVQGLVSLGATVVVATDHQEIVQACGKFEVPSVMTSASHQSGSERVAEVARMFPEKTNLLNVQGDEPFVELEDLTRLMTAHEKDCPETRLSTLVFRSQVEANFNKPSIVKVARARNGEALYFSRAPIPYNRDEKFQGFWHHLGVYAYTQKAIADFCSLPFTSTLETTECLEQLRWLEAGYRIQTVEARACSVGIDTQEDLEIARNIWFKRKSEKS